MLIVELPCILQTLLFQALGRALPSAHTPSSSLYQPPFTHTICTNNRTDHVSLQPKCEAH